MRVARDLLYRPMESGIHPLCDFPLFRRRVFPVNASGFAGKDALTVRLTPAYVCYNMPAPRGCIDLR